MFISQYIGVFWPINSNLAVYQSKVEALFPTAAYNPMCGHRAMISEKYWAQLPFFPDPSVATISVPLRRLQQPEARYYRRVPNFKQTGRKRKDVFLGFIIVI